MNSMETVWFEVGLDSLQLEPANLSGWPQGMSRAGSRMQEECLESVVAFNLDVLFPDEDLLLLGIRPVGWRSPDVLALDPLGFLRLMELKPKPTRFSDLRDQLLSYGLARETLTAWEDLTAKDFPDLPERIDLSLEAFRLNARAENLRTEYVKEHTPGALSEPWDSKNRFEKYHARATALRAARGAAKRFSGKMRQL